MSTDAWMALLILATIVLFPSSFFIAAAIEDRQQAKKVAEAKARSFPVRGTIARFATSATDEYSVDYAFKLVGDDEVYYVVSTSMRPGHDELTSPGDVVGFQVYPGLKYVRDFRNATTA